MHYSFPSVEYTCTKKPKIRKWFVKIRLLKCSLFFNEKILICKSLKSCSARHVCTFWNNAYFRVCRAPCSRRSFTCQLGETLGKASETRVTEFVIENRPKNSYFGQKQRNFFSNSARYGGRGERYPTFPLWGGTPPFRYGGVPPSGRILWLVSEASLRGAIKS